MTGTVRPLARWMAFVLFAGGLVVASLANAGSTIPNHFAVNAGGPALDARPGWALDTQDARSPYLVAGGTRTPRTSRAIDTSHPSIPAGTPASVFQSARADLRDDPSMRWSFPVTPGAWEVRLYFSENNRRRQQAGDRLFDVRIEGHEVLSDFDVFAAAGGGYRGVMAGFLVQSDGALDVEFKRERRRPIVSGIELISLEAPREPAAAPQPTDPPPAPQEPAPSEPSEPAPTQPPASSGSCSGVTVPSGGNIQAAVNSAPQGATLCLKGSYALSTAVKPKQGQSFVGPATIVGAGGNDTGFSVKVPNVSFVNLEMSGFGLRGVDCSVGTRIIGGRYHHNGRNGFGCGLDGLGGVLVDGVEVDHNGSEAELGKGSSGMKFARGHGIVVRNSSIHDNLGSGVWCDVQCGDYTVVDNVIVRNSRKGVHYEKSGASDEFVMYEGFAYIARNVIQDNGWEGRDHAADGGIGLVSSKNVLIEQNTFGGNPRGGVFVRQDGRLSGDKHGWVIANVVIRNNTMNGDRVVGCDLEGVTCR